MTKKERIQEFIEISEKLRKNNRGNINFFPNPKSLKQENAIDIKKANELLKDLKNTPHHFVLACVMDMGTKAEIAWIIPYKVITAFCKLKYVKKDSIKELAEVNIEKYEYIFQDYYENNLHRYNYMAKRFYDAVVLIKNRYNFDVSKIWLNKPSSEEVVKRFREFNGVGQKISTMAANILTRDFGIKFSDYKKIDISLDKHVMLVMKRLGFVQYDEDEDLFKAAIVFKARELNPDYPGIFDFACFTAGRNYCKNKNPDCSNCILKNICKKFI